jgi:hypothetical protein
LSVPTRPTNRGYRAVRRCCEACVEALYLVCAASLAKRATLRVCGQEEVPDSFTTPPVAIGVVGEVGRRWKAHLLNFFKCARSFWNFSRTS